VLNQQIKEMQSSVLEDICKALKLGDDPAVKDHLEVKFQSVFQEYSLCIFKLEDSQIEAIVSEKYLPRATALLGVDEEAVEMLDDNAKSPDFSRFVRAAFKLNLHMFLNDPPISMGVQPHSQRVEKQSLIEQFEFWMYNKNDYYCIDGFPKEGNPCVVVLPPPYRAGYVY